MELAQTVYEKQSKQYTSRLLAASGVVALIAGSGAVAFFDPTKTHMFPVCPLYAITGFACPGCGLTRAFHALFQGDIVTAIDFNLLTPVWAAIFGYLVVSLILVVIRGKGLPMWPISPKFLAIFAGILLIFGVVRNIPVYPFTILFP